MIFLQNFKWFWKKNHSNSIKIIILLINWFNKTINEMTVDGLTPWVLPKAQKSGKTVISFISSHWHNKLQRHYTEGYAIGAINTLMNDDATMSMQFFTHKFRINNKISMAALSKRYRNGVSWNVLRNELSAIFCLQD